MISQSIGMSTSKDVGLSRDLTDPFAEGLISLPKQV